VCLSLLLCIRGRPFAGETLRTLPVRYASQRRAAMPRPGCCTQLQGAARRTHPPMTAPNRPGTACSRCGLQAGAEQLPRRGDRARARARLPAYACRRRAAAAAPPPPSACPRLRTPNRSGTACVHLQVQLPTPRCSQTYIRAHTTLVRRHAHAALRVRTRGARRGRPFAGETLRTLCPDADAVSLFCVPPRAASRVGPCDALAPPHLAPAPPLLALRSTTTCKSGQVATS
jgi:hypothetical protein